MKMRVRRTKQTRHCFQGWFESAGYLARTIRNINNRRFLRERFMRGDFEIIDGEFWPSGLILEALSRQAGEA